MEEILGIALPVVIKYAPELITDIKDALSKKGLTAEQIDAIFANVLPYEKLGINPDAPVKAEPTAPAA